MEKPQSGSQRVAAGMVKIHKHAIRIHKLQYLTGTIYTMIITKYIPFDIFPRCNFTQFTYFWKTALHVSGGIFTHHQEHI
jgi:hypothetical protein